MNDGGAKSFLLTQLKNQSSVAGTKVLSTSEQLKTVAAQLRSDDLTRPVASIADRGAEALDRVGRYLRESDGETLVADADRFGRERPWVLATAGLALGLAGSRMIKASAARRGRPAVVDITDVAMNANAAGASSTEDSQSKGTAYNGA